MSHNFHEQCLKPYLDRVFPPCLSQAMQQSLVQSDQLYLECCTSQYRFVPHCLHIFHGTAYAVLLRYIIARVNRCKQKKSELRNMSKIELSKVHLTKIFKGIIVLAFSNNFVIQQIISSSNKMSIPIANVGHLQRSDQSHWCTYVLGSGRNVSPYVINKLMIVIIY